jgi:hypothetical protein
MPNVASFESFEKELRRLVAKFEQGINEFKNPSYLEAQLRDDFLNPFFSALGWDLENDAGLIQKHREVEIESRTGDGRADYLFRPERKPRFVCEAKKPAEELHGDYAMQAKRYAWTIGVRLALLSDFEELKIYIVTGNPDKGEPDDGLWRSYDHTEYAARARELWDLLARDNVAGGSIERLLESLPKKLRPDRARDFDEEFLAFLDGHRRALASDLVRHNDREDLLEGTRLNEAVQCILDRLLFIRISEARGIDIGTKLQSLLETWKARQEKSDRLREEPPAHWGGSGLSASRGTLWNSIVRHIRALDRRPPSHVPYFNGNLFKVHFSEELVVGDVWLSEFLESISGENSPYKFGYVAVEILGTIYERFLGKIVRPHGRGAVIEEKPEVRKAGGVYYTPRYIVEYIVEQTVGKLLEGRKPEQTLKLRFLDPACGSGSFLICVFERVCEHWQQWFLDNPAKRKKDWCWLDAKTNTLHLTVRSKRRILRETIHGVDLDPQAVEVTQLSLYLKMLEGETAETLQREQDFFDSDEPILPPLQDNIKCGNSLIASDFSVLPDDLVRVHAFDWSVQFELTMKAGGFDAVVGNPPYGAELNDEERRYLQRTFGISLTDTAALFILLKKRLLKRRGLGGYIVPKPLLYNSNWRETRDKIIKELSIACDCGKVWPEVKLEQIICVIEKASDTPDYISASRDGQAIQHFGKLSKKLCSEFQFILSNVSPAEVKLAQKMKSSARYLGNVLKNQRGAMLQGSVSSGAGYYEVLGGKQIGRYCVAETLKGRMARAAVADEKAFVKPNSVLVQNIVAHIENPVDHIQIIATVLPDESQENSVILDTVNQLSVAKPLSALFIAAILNSKLINWFTYRFIFARAIRTMHFDAPVTDRIPFCKLDFTKSADRKCHDKLVVLVDKILGLMPKLRAAKSDSEKATLQNAVTATDQQIDALVYNLYGLTEKEIKLVDQASRT